MPQLLLLLVWGVGIAGFLVLAARFEFLGINFHGLPRQESFFIFWGFVIACFSVGVVWGARCVWLYLAVLPGLFILDALRIFPFGQLPLHALNLLVTAWVLKSLFRGNFDLNELRWPDFLVGCLAVMATIGSVYGLAHPSWENSLSVAFSIFGWEGQNTEFNALWMGHHFLAGCMVYLMARIASVRQGPHVLHRITAAQLIVLVLAWVGFHFVKLLTGSADFSETHLFPLLSKHDLAGYSVLALGYFLGLASFPHGIFRARLINGCCAIVALMLLLLSASKAALLVAPMLLAVGILRFFRLRPMAIFIILAVAAFGFSMLALAKGHLPAPLAHAIDLAFDPKTLVADDSSTFRVKTWRNAVEMVRQFPVTGTGLGSSVSLLPHFPVDGFLGTLNWRVYANPELTRDFDMTHNGFHCHNDFLEVAVSMGLPALLIFLTLYFFLLALGSKNFFRCEHCEQAPGHIFGGAVFLCFLGYGVFSFFDSRIVSLAGSIFFFQFVALGVSATTGRGDEVHVGCWNWLAPALAPLILLLGSSVVLTTDALPSDRTYGIWNWNKRDSTGSNLLAKEAQFLVPPFEALAGLAFRLPESAGPEEGKLFVQINEDSPMQITIRKGVETAIALDRHPDQWTKVLVRANIWCGRGALGSPLGMDPYSVAMRKIRNSDTSDIWSEQPAVE